MKVNVDVVLKTISGETMMDTNDKGEAVEATLKTGLVNALLAPKQKQDSGVDKIKTYELAKRIYTGGEVELSAEEISLCKKAVDDTFPSPQVVGQICELLEGNKEEA